MEKRKAARSAAIGMSTDPNRNLGCDGLEEAARQEGHKL